jgi:hypothetical protein
MAMILRPLTYASKTLQAPPWNNPPFTVERAYDGKVPEHVTLSTSMNIHGYAGEVTYAVKNLTGQYKVNASCLLKQWSTNASGLTFSLKHLNSLGVVSVLYTVTQSDITSDNWFTDDSNNTKRSVRLLVDLTGDDKLVVTIEGSGNTGPISAEVYDIVIF